MSSKSKTKASQTANDTNSIGASNDDVFSIEAGERTTLDTDVHPLLRDFPNDFSVTIAQQKLLSRDPASFRDRMNEKIIDAINHVQVDKEVENG